MQKSRPLLDAQCGHSKQCQTNNHLLEFWQQAAQLYNDPNISYSSRVFLEYGKPFDKSVTILQGGDNYHMQADSFKKKYTDSRRTIDKIHGNLSASGEGEGSYSGCEVQNFTNADHDAFKFLTLQEEGQVSDYSQSFDKNMLQQHPMFPRHSPRDTVPRNRSLVILLHQWELRWH